MGISNYSMSLPAPLDSAVRTSIEDWEASGKVRRLWEKDAKLWTGSDEASWLDWLSLPDDRSERSRRLTSVAEEIKSAGFSQVLLLGMGGSSLCPEVLRMTFGKIDAYPELHVLDSTDPAQIGSFERRLDLSKTLFIVSSKSGSTLEPEILREYFFERTARLRGNGSSGDQFIAITDRGSRLHETAVRDRFRRILFGVPGVGGRYSALSDFGVAPAAIMGIDIRCLLDRSYKMAELCSGSVPVGENPGALLGIVLGVLAQKGRDKATIVASPRLSDFGAWLEQLLAESTGKQKKGIIPVDGEQLGLSEMYGPDRLFIYLRLESDADRSQDNAVDSIEKAGHPVLRISLADLYDLGGEFFRWEFATAVAGSILGINPFDQPDVEASKKATRTLTAEYEATGVLPEEPPILEENGITLFAEGTNAAKLAESAGADKSLVAYLRAHLSQLNQGDYFAALAYIEMSDHNRNLLQAIRHSIRDRKRAATCLGFGPRFLHSTGQAYKGGPNSGVFLQITCEDVNDIKVPHEKFTFGVVKSAQARGDLQVLTKEGRRVLRVHLGRDVQSGLKALGLAIEQALA